MAFNENRRRRPLVFVNSRFRNGYNARNTVSDTNRRRPAIRFNFTAQSGYANFSRLAENSTGTMGNMRSQAITGASFTTEDAIQMQLQLKSPVSLIYEVALQLQMEVKFEVCLCEVCTGCTQSLER